MHLLLLDNTGKTEKPAWSTAKTQHDSFLEHSRFGANKYFPSRNCISFSRKSCCQQDRFTFQLPIVAGLTAKLASCGKGSMARGFRVDFGWPTIPAVKIFHAYYAKIYVDINRFRDYSSRVLPDLVPCVFLRHTE